jgi:3-hydroxy-5-methyl-1-naphthoate 3-O-methyltransferase
MRIRTEADVDDLVRAAKLLAVASAWAELGLWDELARRGEPVDLGELVGDLRALEITAPVLGHAGLLDGGGRVWALSRVAREMHARGELPTGRNLGFLDDLGRMADVVRDGGPVRGPDGAPRVTSGGVRPDDLEATRAFLAMLYRRSGSSAEAVADWLAPRLGHAAHVLDVGGGHGRYGEALVGRGHRVTVFDLPVVIELARERHGDALAYLAGDFHRDDFGGPYDAALLSNVVHGEAPDANADMARRLFAALAPGGWVVYKDMFIDELGREPDHAVFFGTTMLYYTAAGRSYTLRDVAAWCREAGFEAPEVAAVDTFSLVFARKPG